jgi:hypothetical protein
MNLKDQFFTIITQHPYYPTFAQEVKGHRPTIPAHDPHADNTEVWKSHSAQAKGFDLACSLIGIK